MDLPLTFRDFPTAQRDQQERLESEIPSYQSHQTDLSFIFKSIEDIITFVKRELKRFKNILSPDLPECIENQEEDEEVVDAEEERQESSAREGALKITLQILRNMDQKELADILEKKKEFDVFDLRKYSRTE
uniref:Uncharacterized protein n=1 Tax=Hucho hucho TaxID=62062 RepID=A0A4W5NDR4_9TELE